MDKQYLGDGVFIHHDGSQMWLTTERSDGMLHEIAVDAEMAEGIVAYWKAMLLKYAGAS